MSPVSTMPQAETALLLEAYGAARVILEFGSGASTALAAQMPGKYIQSVESDRVWARNLRAQLAAEKPKSPAIVHHVDIGPTGRWGRPIDSSGWQLYPEYPNGIWDQPFFRHPDVILIDGRFRAACLMASMLRITRPVRVLFDDYRDRPSYHLVEQLLRPRQMAGRMAEFHLTPGMVQPSDIGFVIRKFFEITFSGKGLEQYSVPPAAAAEPPPQGRRQSAAAEQGPPASDPSVSAPLGSGPPASGPSASGPSTSGPSGSGQLGSGPLASGPSPLSPSPAGTAASNPSASGPSTSGQPSKSAAPVSQGPT